MRKLISIALELSKEKKKYFENWKKYGEKIKNFVENLLGENVRLIFFGSIVKGNYTIGSSDIDVIIISDRFHDRNLRFFILSKLLERYLESPFEFHLITTKEFEKWYKKFIKEEFVEI